MERLSSPRRLWLLLCVLLCPFHAAAGDSWEPRVCYEACHTALKPVHFDDMIWSQSGFVSLCNSMRGLTALYLCLDVYCTPESREDGLGPLNSTCEETVNKTIPSWDLISNYSDADIANLRRVDLDESTAGDIFFEIVLPDKALFGAWWDTLDSVAYVNAHHLYYGAAMAVFWGIAVAIGMTSHLISAISNWRFLQRQSFKPIRGAWDCYARLRTLVTVPATFGGRCAQKVGWGTVPPRIQSLTLVAFLIINIVFSIHGYRIVPINMYFPDQIRQILRYSSDRTGIISFANFPVIWLFGMRNNLLMWVTGWDFGTYNNFHRWVARIATAQAILHSVGYTVLILREGGWSYFAYWWQSMFWWAGEAATIFMSLIVLFSFYWIRRQQYELFLIIHIVMSIIVLITMLGHVSIFMGEYDALFWIPVFIWIGDRVLRVLRILSFNPKFWNTRAAATYNPSSNIVRLIVPWSTSFYKPAAGTYYYLHVLNGSRIWESHPFTVASVLDHGKSAAKLLGEQVPLLESNEPDATADTTDVQSIMEDPCNMTFLIRPYDGFTSRLQAAASEAWPRKAPMKVLVDGPYGHTLPFHLYDNVVFIVGGSGIVVPLSYLQVLTAQEAPRSVKIVWAVREPTFALDVLQTDIGDALGSPNLSVEIHLTSHATRDDITDWPPQVALRSGRIDAPATIVDAADSADGGSVAIVACGPAQMADAARKTVATMVGKGTKRLEYFEESFEW